jgi:hypothetical protein
MWHTPLSLTVIMTLNSKDAAILVQLWTSTEGSKSLRLQDFKTLGIWRWLVSPTPRPPLPHRKYSCYSFLLEAAAGRNMSVKNSIDNIDNRTRDLPTCSAVPELTALPREPDFNSAVSKVSGYRERVDKVRFALETGIITFGATSMYKCKGKTKCNTASVYRTLIVTKGSISLYAVAWEIRV